VDDLRGEPWPFSQGNSSTASPLKGLCHDTFLGSFRTFAALSSKFLGSVFAFWCPFQKSFLILGKKLDILDLY
jgi:hypothetical protein